MPLKHSVHAHSVPCYVTTPTRHDNVHSSISLCLSMNSWLTKLRVLFVKATYAQDERVSLLSPYCQQSQSAASDGLRLRSQDAVQTSLTLSKQSLLELHSWSSGSLKTRVQVTYSPSINAVLVALSSYILIHGARRHCCFRRLG